MQNCYYLFCRYVLVCLFVWGSVRRNCVVTRQVFQGAPDSLRPGGAHLQLDERTESLYASKLQTNGRSWTAKTKVNSHRVDGKEVSKSS